MAWKYSWYYQIVAGCWSLAGAKWPAGKSFRGQMEAWDCQAQRGFVSSFINRSGKLDEAEEMCVPEPTSGHMPKRRHEKHRNHNSKGSKIKYFTETTSLVFKRQTMNHLYDHNFGLLSAQGLPWCASLCLLFLSLVSFLWQQKQFEINPRRTDRHFPYVKFFLKLSVHLLL